VSRERFSLNDLEARTPLWMRVRGHMEQRLAELRAQNDTPLDDRKTAELRGRIAMLKELLAADKPLNTED
jgi:hypothetical protein